MGFLGGWGLSKRGQEAADYEEEDGEASSRAGPGSEMESRTSTDIIDAKAIHVMAGFSKGAEAQARAQPGVLTI